MNNLASDFRLRWKVEFNVPNSSVHRPRWAVVFDGLETAEEVKAALELDPVMALIECAPETSRLHASRRVFTEMNKLGATVPVIHHMVFAEGAVGDDIVIQSGAQAGGLGGGLPSLVRTIGRERCSLSLRRCT